MSERIKKLYEELGPMLFARASRVLKDETAAQEVTLVVIEELANEGKLSPLQLARKGRELVKHHCAIRSSNAFDSLLPGEVKPWRG